MMRVFIAPTYRHKDEKGDGGIRRVSDALWKYLPNHSITPTTNPDDCDLLNCHGGMLVERPDIPLVASCHGLYWSEYKWDRWAHETNRQVTEVLIRASAITSPSKWVTNALTRGLLCRPKTIYHGVDAGEWTPGQSQGYVLWNKARHDAVSNFDDMQQLAALMRNTNFVSTLGKPTHNVKVTGAVGYEEMKGLVSSAGVYLATARETFGIGTLEALSCGVPVAGWDYGGQSEIIKQGETGYLAPYGDYSALADCIQACFHHRERLSANARQDVLERWLWPDKIAQYAELFLDVYNEWHKPRAKVSVVVTCHNLGRYLPECLDSVASQSMDDWECVIVDDWSSDDTLEIAKRYTLTDKRFKCVRPTENLKLSAARNYGYSHTTGKYIINLDADDKLSHTALEILSNALDSDNSIHIAYGHLDTINDAGEDQKRNTWPTDSFDWYQQIAHLNQLPYAAMLRRSVMDDTGGYRRRDWRAEDASFWIRATSFGKRIKKVTGESTLIYRIRGDSKSADERKKYPDADGDWTAWYPWRLAGSAQEGLSAMKRKAYPKPSLVPWSAQGQPPEGAKWWPVSHHASPLVSVIIPVGPGHEKYLIDALDSLVAQTFQRWEVIVINDTGKEWRGDYPIEGAPYARIINGDKSRGAGAARNRGAAIAKGEYIVFLDADDIILPTFLEICLSESKHSNRLVYTDWLMSKGDTSKALELVQTDDWQCSAYNESNKLIGVLNQMQHGVTCVIPRKAFVECGGFDESMQGWEEWDLFIKLHSVGLCSVRIPQALFIYRVNAGFRRDKSEHLNKELRQYIYTKWHKYYTGDDTMPCPGGCGNNGVQQVPAPSFDPVSAAMDGLPAGTVMVEYIGLQQGKFTISGVNGTPLKAAYVFANTDAHRRKYVFTEDAQLLISIRKQGRPEYQLVSNPAPVPHAPIQAGPARKVESVSMQEFIDEQKAEEPKEVAAVAIEPPKITKSIDAMSVDELRDQLESASMADILKWKDSENKGKRRKNILNILNSALAAYEQRD